MNLISNGVLSNPMMYSRKFLCTVILDLHILTHLCCSHATYIPLTVSAGDVCQYYLHVLQSAHIFDRLDHEAQE